MYAGASDLRGRGGTARARLRGCRHGGGRVEGASRRDASRWEEVLVGRSLAARGVQIPSPIVCLSGGGSSTAVRLLGGQLSECARWCRGQLAVKIWRVSRQPQPCMSRPAISNVRPRVAPPPRKVCLLSINKVSQQSAPGPPAVKLLPACRNAFNVNSLQSSPNATPT